MSSTPNTMRLEATFEVPFERGDSSASLTLPDGRKLGYALYGSEIGPAIILNHGLACSRYEGLFYHETAQQLGTRIIAVDRPGMGLSTPQPSRKLLDFAKDIEHLTEHLKLDTYSVMGISGGGPATLACAKSLPATKLKAIAMIVALGPPDIGMSGARILNRIGFPNGYRFCPSLLHKWYWRLDAIGRVELSDEERLKMLQKQREKSKYKMPKKDFDASTDEFYRKALKSTRGGFAQGYDGVLQDARLDCYEFGFKVEDIRPELPVHLWYGKQDVLVPPNHGVQLKIRLGKSAHLHLEDETHVSLTVNFNKEILENLIKHM